MTRLNLRQMEVFRAVMLTGTVNAAAELLHVSQPAVSKLLAQAARRSGLVLFERVRGRLIPTAEGTALYQEIDKLWRGVEHVRDVSRQLANPTTGALRLAVSASLAPHLVPKSIALLQADFPSVKCSAEILIAPIMVDALLDRTADLGIGLLPNPHPNLVAVQTHACGLVCVMRDDHPLAARSLIQASDLEGQRVISSPEDSPYGGALRRAYGKVAGRLDLDIVVRSSTTACWFAQAGAGIAVVDEAAVAGGTFAGLAVRRFRSHEKLQVQVLRHRYRPLSRLQQAFCGVFERVWRESIG